MSIFAYLSNNSSFPTMACDPLQPWTVVQKYSNRKKSFMEQALSPIKTFNYPHHSHGTVAPLGTSVLQV